MIKAQLIRILVKFKQGGPFLMASVSLREIYKKYAEYVEGCGSTYGEKIIPITEDEAKEWVEKYLTVDEYIKIFGECEE